jgi:hypothetical protein
MSNDFQRLDKDEKRAEEYTLREYDYLKKIKKIIEKSTEKDNLYKELRSIIRRAGRFAYRDRTVNGLIKDRIEILKEKIDTHKFNKRMDVFNGVILKNLDEILIVSEEQVKFDAKKDKLLNLINEAIEADQGMITELKQLNAEIKNQQKELNKEHKTIKTSAEVNKEIEKLQSLGQKDKNGNNDIMVSLDLIKAAIWKEKTFKNYDDESLVKFILLESKSLTKQLSDYVNSNELHLHVFKRNCLLNVITGLEKLQSYCLGVLKHSKDVKSNTYKIWYSPTDLQVFGSTFVTDIKGNYEKYMNFGGSVYLFRHCEKTKRLDKNGQKYDSLSKETIKEQAMLRAKQIAKEVAVSPKRVEIYFYHSEEKRTKLFAQIIEKEVKNIFGTSIFNFKKQESKVGFFFKGYEDRIKFSYFDKEALEELWPLYSKYGEYKSLVSWYFNLDEFKTLKKQPKPKDVVKGIRSFIDEMSAFVKAKQDVYRIVVAISHSWTIDAYLYDTFKGLETRTNDIIPTAYFVKSECGQINYRNEWA